MSINTNQQTSSSLATKGAQTRQRIIEVAAELIHRQGYHYTGLQQILTEAGVTKGAFYFHFKDKKALALAVIEHFGGFFRQVFAKSLLDQSLSPWQQLEGFQQQILQLFSAQEVICGCPIGNLTLEVAAMDEDMQQHLAAALGRLSNRFAAVISQGQQQQCFITHVPAQSLADFLVNSWQGAVLRVKAEQSLQPLHDWFSSVRMILQPPQR
ncbi:TetR/AcrR family transcriptional regulator [Balneatrix alpica]|uniref:TetR/AcrR family transcriptional regulator n=1 Tax=Balneatrix alpica TaxID=75684 RepID=A0ABV5ZAA3_9GAMM|nr:TetR/AcrR family transcriptional regulator [Balneatrix alpica]